jgi:aryl-alcohol dehydrogenase-like predicted oxidoreductase
MFEAVTDPAEAVLVAAWDSGVRNLDTAPPYDSGLSEHRFGNVLRRYPREAFTLSTKAGAFCGPTPACRRMRPSWMGALPWRSRKPLVRFYLACLLLHQTVISAWLAEFEDKLVRLSTDTRFLNLERMGICRLTKQITLLLQSKAGRLDFTHDLHVFDAVER